MAVNLNGFNALKEKLSAETAKQAENAGKQLKADIKQEERRRQEEYDKAAQEAQRASMGPLTALMRGDFQRFGEALIEEDPHVMLAKGDFSGAVNKFLDLNQEAGTVLLNTVGQVAAGMGPTIAAAINTGVDSAQRAANEAAGTSGRGDTSMSVQDQADLARTVADPAASAEEKAAAGARLLANAASFIPAAGAGAAAAQKLLLEGSKAALKAAPGAVQAARAASEGDLLGAGLQGAALASSIAGAAAPGGGGTPGKIGIRDLARAGAGAAGGIASFARTGNADNLANSLSGAASGLLGKAGKNELAAGINYGSNILTGNAGAALARAAGTAAGNALRDGVQQSPLGTGDTRVKPGEDTYTVEAEGARHTFKSKEEAEQYAADHALTVHDAGGEAAFIKQQDEDEARALQVFLESAGYQALPESLKEQAAEMFKGKGGALAYQAERPDLLTPLQGTLEGKTYGQGDTTVGTLRAGGGRADTDAGRMFRNNLEELEKNKKELIAKKDTLVKEYSQKIQDEYNALIGNSESAAEFQKLQTAYNKDVQKAKEAGARGGTVENPVKGERLRELEKELWHFPVPTEEQSLEITPYQRQEYTGGTKTAPLEVLAVPGETVGNTVKPGLVTPAFVPDPIAPEPREAVFNPEYGWSLAGADFSGGNKSIGFQGEEAYTPEAAAAAPVQEEQTHDWAEYISAQYGGPLVYSDEALKKIQYFTVPKSRKLRKTFERLANELR